MKQSLPRSIDELFEVTFQEPNTGCWLWPRGEHAPSRVLYQRLIRKIPRSNKRFGKLYVLHTCDVRACVNPEHLYVGTHQQNTIDAVQRGRIARGETHSMAKLTNEEAAAIASDARDRRILAEAYDVSVNTIGKIQRGVSYCYGPDTPAAHPPHREERILRLLVSALQSEHERLSHELREVQLRLRDANAALASIGSTERRCA